MPGTHWLVGKDPSATATRTSWYLAVTARSWARSASPGAACAAAPPSATASPVAAIAIAAVLACFMVSPLRIGVAAGAVTRSSVRGHGSGLGGNPVIGLFGRAEQHEHGGAGGQPGETAHQERPGQPAGGRGVEAVGEGRTLGAREDLPRLPAGQLLAERLRLCQAAVGQDAGGPLGE